MGLFAVALLAARHGITVTLSRPLDGGTTAEVYLPAALISLGNAHGNWQGGAGEAAVTGGGEAPSAGAGGEAGAGVTELPVRFAAEPESAPALETDELEAVPVMMSAPVPAPPETATAVTAPEQVSGEPGDGPPIFESVRSGYLQAFGRDLPASGEQQAGRSAAARPATPPASWGDGNGHAAAGPRTADSPASPGLPQRTPQPGQARGAAADEQGQHAAVTESAESTRSKLASFQRGSRRARATAQNRSAQPGQDG
jgi:hypothetical protein